LEVLEKRRRPAEVLEGETVEVMASSGALVQELLDGQVDRASRSGGRATLDERDERVPIGDEFLTVLTLTVEPIPSRAAIGGEIARASQNAGVSVKYGSVRSAWSSAALPTAMSPRLIRVSVPAAPDTVRVTVYRPAAW
jgi:hypothetical protein